MPVITASGVIDRVITSVNLSDSLIALERDEKFRKDLKETFDSSQSTFWKEIIIPVYQNAKSSDVGLEKYRFFIAKVCKSTLGEDFLQQFKFEDCILSLGLKEALQFINETLLKVPGEEKNIVAFFPGIKEVYIQMAQEYQKSPKVTKAVQELFKEYKKQKENEKIAYLFFILSLSVDMAYKTYNHLIKKNQEILNKEVTQKLFNIILQDKTKKKAFEKVLNENAFLLEKLKDFPDSWQQLCFLPVSFLPYEILIQGLTEEDITTMEATNPINLGKDPHALFKYLKARIGLTAIKQQNAISLKGLDEYQKSNYINFILEHHKEINALLIILENADSKWGADLREKYKILVADPKTLDRKENSGSIQSNENNNNFPFWQLLSLSPNPQTEQTPPSSPPQKEEERLIKGLRK